MERKNFNTIVVKNPKTNRFEHVCLDTGEVLNDLVPTDMDKYKFNYDMAQLICQKIREGATLKSIGDDPTLPSLTVIHYWRRSNPTFDDEIKLARKDRAEYFHDKVLQIAGEVVDKDDVAVAKFKADQYKWAAEKGDPSSYGNKIEHTGSNVAPTLVVVTGISRDAPVETTAREIEDVDKAGEITHPETQEEEIDDSETESNEG